MKRFFSFAAILTICLLISGCIRLPVSTGSSEPTAATVQPTLSTTLPTEESTAPTTLPEHTPLYIPGLDAEDVIRYFNEVCLDAEFVNSGDPSRLQRWEVPIYYQISGEPTQQDLAVIEEFAGWLNTIEGFPGIYETTDPEEANMQVSFCDQEELVSLLGDNFYDMDGGVTFWYMDNAITDAIIGYRVEIDQHVRNSVILEEIYNGLGPIQDTALREDSIIFSGYSEPQSLTEIDQLILQLLYHPLMECGMNMQQCEAVIRQLYY